VPAASPSADQFPVGPLLERLTTLAGTPDDDRSIPGCLTSIAQLAADRIAPVSYASITGQRPEGYTTVAASSDLARAVDEVQYADSAGPCLDALDEGRLVGVSDISATMSWPGFRDTAMKLGLRASLSIPLFAGRGTPLAALNLYSHDAAAMRALTAAVRSVYDVGHKIAAVEDRLDAGGSELMAGLTGAFAVRAILQQALGVTMSLTGSGPDEAYAALRLRAAEDRIALTEAAGRLISGQRW
jgi:hypothetical protein